MTYTNSSLVTYKRLSSHKSVRKHEVDSIIIHCIVGQWTAQKGCDYFATTDRDCSANYVVGCDGSIGLSVEEQYRAWCSGGSDKNGNPIRVNGISGADFDHRAIAIEVASDTAHPYAVTDKAYTALIELCADICKRNGIKKLLWQADKSLVGNTEKQNMGAHRWFANKSCPGDYLYNRFSDIASKVNAKLSATTSSVALAFKSGDIVQFAGGKHYRSANATEGTSVKASKAKVTRVYKTGKHPYQLRAVNDSGSFISGVYGWVDVSTVSALKTMTSSTTTSNATTTTATSTVAVNDVVKIASNATYYSGSTIPTWVKNKAWIVKSVSGDRVVIDKSQDGANAINSAINAKFLTVVALSPVTPYKVQMSTNHLDIRKGAGTNYSIVKTIEQKGVYTIVDEALGAGATKWGLLKSYQKNRNGWISLDAVKKI